MQKSEPFNELMQKYKQDMMNTYHTGKVKPKPMSRTFDTVEQKPKSPPMTKKAQKDAENFFYREEDFTDTQATIGEVVARPVHFNEFSETNQDDLIRSSKAYIDLMEMNRDIDTPDYDRDTFGYLEISVTTANSAIPIPDAHIIIFAEENNKLLLQRLLTTDESGNTEAVPLPAPMAKYSQTPNNSGEKPYSEYNVFISADGFRPVENINVPIFANVKSILPVNLLPLSEYEEFDGVVIENIGREPNL